MIRVQTILSFEHVVETFYRTVILHPFCILKLNTQEPHSHDGVSKTKVLKLFTATRQKQSSLFLVKYLQDARQINTVIIESI